VLALDFFYFFKEEPGRANRVHFLNLCFTAKTIPTIEIYTTV